MTLKCGLIIIKMINWINFILDNNKKINIKYEDLQNYYYPILFFKWIKKIELVDKELNAGVNISYLNIKYINYIQTIRKIDKHYNKSIEVLDINQNDNYLKNLGKDYTAILSYNHLIKNMNKSKQTKSIYINIMDENNKNIVERRVDNKLVVPYYFFTPSYIEKSKPSQIKHWSSSVYSYLKSNKIEMYYLDYYSEKLINSFFNINLVRIKNIWDERILLDGYKIIPSNNIVQDINTLIKYTSINTNKSLRSVINYSKIILNYPWFKEKVKFSVYLKELIKDRKTLKFGGFFAKKRIDIDYANRGILSKPIFKHTSYNLIIDLFIFNNKKYIFNKFDHIIWRRTIYKYMYSMYINYFNKINDTISRPRFFYINIIEPNIYNYYKKVVKAYENILLLNYKVYFVYACLLLLKWKQSYINIQDLNKLTNLFNLKEILHNKHKLLFKDKDLHNLLNNKNDKERKEKLLYINKSLNKEEIIKKSTKQDYYNSWLINSFTKFYLYNNLNNIFINDNKQIKDFLNSAEFKKSFIKNNKLKDKFNLLKSKKELYSEYEKKNSIDSRGTSVLRKKSKILYNKNISNFPKYKIFNSKIIWDSLDSSLIFMLYDIIKVKNYKSLFNKLNKDSLFLMINFIIKNNNVLYYINRLALIENEFYVVNRDITKINQFNMIPYIYENTMNSYSNFESSIKDKIILKKSKNENIEDIYMWRSFLKNKKNNVNLQLYNNNIFKPYYRYMLSLFILESYKSMLLFIGYKNIISFFNEKFIKINNLKSFIINNNILYNYIMIKVLLGLFKHNYISLIKVKPKYYYINKLRYYESKIRRLKFNTWLSSIKYLKKLRKTPRNFWKRYHKLAMFYFGRIVQNAELDAKRKIFVPFLIYFEDILYTIYNKPVVLRLWPLKKYFLSSIILTKRIMATILIRQHKISLGGYRKVIRKLISTFRALEIKKAYVDYVSNNGNWSTELINILDNETPRKSMKYSNLEYFSKSENRYHFLNTYFLKYYNLSNYVPIVKNNYLKTFWNNIFKLRVRMRKQIIKSFKRSNLSRLNYTYYWVKPLKNYIIQLRRNLDISGIKFRLAGRSGIRRSNMRKFKRTKYFGNLMGPVHTNMIIKRNISLYNAQLTGKIKSNIDYSYGWGITRNGCLSLKIWISSLFSVDLRELLLHLVRIKYLYYYLINRYYTVETKLILNNITNNINLINETINKYNNKKKVKKRENNIYSNKRWSFIVKDHINI